MAQYGSSSYWDERYKKDQDFFDWYQRWSGLKDVMKNDLNKSDKILIVGCGRSKLSEDLYDDGFKNQTNIDLSSVAINAMKEIYNKTHSSMEFIVMDGKDMKEFKSGIFDVVIDKGTLDSVLCGEGSTQHALSMLKEISRVLKPKGIFFCITYGQPSFRITYLDRPEFNWSIEVRATPKPTIGTEVALAADDKDGVHYIYVCMKGDGCVENESNLVTNL